MKGYLALRNPVQASCVLDTSGTNVTSSAYVTLLAKANKTVPNSAICVSNSGAQPMMLAKGDAGSEVDTGIVIPPSSFAILLPIELPKSVRLSVKSLGSTQSTGIITASFYA